MNKNLLIVDDDLPFRDRLCKSMEKKGFIVESFSDAKATSSRIKEKRSKKDSKMANTKKLMNKCPKLKTTKILMFKIMNLIKMNSL